MKYDDNILEQLERVINDFGAELTVNKQILQCIVTHLICANPIMAEEALERMRSDVISVLKKPHLSDEAEDKRVVALQVQHGERFFRELAAAVSAMRNKLGQSGRN